MLYAVILLIIGLILVLLEVLLPSGGMISVLASVAIIAAAVLGFQHSAAGGAVILVVTFVCIPVLVAFGLKVFPQTAVGRRMLLIPTKSQAEAGVDAPAGVSDIDYSSLVGKAGNTVTPLRPSGIAEINGQRYSVVASGEMIDKDVEIVVLRVEGNSVVVDDRKAVEGC